MKMASKSGGRNLLPEIAIYVILSGSILFSVILEKRAFVIGSSAGLLFYLFNRQRVLRSKHLLFCVIILFLILTFSLACFFKQDSSLGRILIYKVSYLILKKHPLWGIGFGNFKRQYLYYQAEYFMQGNYLPKELMLADNTYFAFNDYFQFLIEFGIVGGVLLLSMIAILLKLTSFSLKKESDNNFLLFSVSLIITIAVGALFTHVFDQLIAQIIFLNALAYILIKAIFHKAVFKKEHIVIIITMFCTDLLLVCNFYQFQIFHHTAFEKVEYAKDLAIEGYNIESMERSDSLYKSCKGQYSFLTFYSTRLLLNGRPSLATKVLKEAIQQEPSYRLFLQLGAANDSLGNTSAAQSSLKTAVFMVPNRFESRFELFKFYRKHNLGNEAIACGTEILNLQIKVPSYRVDLIKEETRRILKELK